MKHPITYLACDDGSQLKNRSIEILDHFLGKENYSFAQDSACFFIASGGSEQHAVKLSEKHNGLILLCHRESNSFAAAMEIAAYLRSVNKYVAVIDVFAEDSKQAYLDHLHILQALKKLNGQKAAVLGEVSEWLINSTIEVPILKEKLGVDLEYLPWNELESYKNKAVSAPFLSYFPDIEQKKLQETARVYSLLEEIISTYKLSAISVECFPMVRNDQVTACLPLAVLNTKNVVAACEGDVCSMIGKMLVKEVAGMIPWQANIAEINKDSVLFAHCTAPLNFLKSFEITTHFETGVGTAIRGKIENQPMAAFRIDKNMEKYMLLEGDIIDAPNHDFACRTQLVFKTSEQQCELLKNKALGNHHLLFPSRYVGLLQRFMEFLNIDRLQ